MKWIKLDQTLKQISFWLSGYTLDIYYSWCGGIVEIEQALVCHVAMKIMR